MLSTQDFAQQVWLSLENIRERLAVLETEARHTRHHLQILENRLSAPAATETTADPNKNAPDNAGATIHIRISRKTLGSLSGGGAIGGGVLAGVMALGRLLGWW